MLWKIRWRHEGRLGLLYAPEDPGCETVRAPVLKVFDGDGFLTRIFIPRREREIECAVRFGFIDAPELGQPGGAEARSFLAQLIGGKSVDLAVLMKMDTGKIIDRHCRIVATPYLTGSINRETVTRNVELEMLLNGWAWLLERYCPNETYYRALDDARRHRRGIWARDDNVEPWEFKRRKYAAAKQQLRRQPSLFD